MHSGWSWASLFSILFISWSHMSMALVVNHTGTDSLMVQKTYYNGQLDRCHLTMYTIHIIFPFKPCSGGACRCSFLV